MIMMLALQIVVALKMDVLMKRLIAMTITNVRLIAVILIMVANMNLSTVMT
jgi:hypothetical protein